MTDTMLISVLFLSAEDISAFWLKGIRLSKIFTLVTECFTEYLVLNACWGSCQKVGFKLYSHYLLFCICTWLVGSWYLFFPLWSLSKLVFDSSADQYGYPEESQNIGFWHMHKSSSSDQGTKLAIGLSNNWLISWCWNVGNWNRALSIVARESSILLWQFLRDVNLFCQKLRGHFCIDRSERQW